MSTKVASKEQVNSKIRAKFYKNLNLTFTSNVTGLQSAYLIKVEKSSAKKTL